MESTTGPYRRHANPFEEEVMELISVSQNDYGGRYVKIHHMEPNENTNVFFWNICAVFGIAMFLILLSMIGAYLWIGLHRHKDLECDITNLEEFTDFLNDTCCNEFNEAELCELSEEYISFDCLSDVNVSDATGDQIVVHTNNTFVTLDIEDICPEPCVNGTDGKDGSNCWDIDGNGLCDLPIEDINDDGVCNQTDCIGLQGDDGMDGANATIDECEKPFGQMCLAEEVAPEFVTPFALNMTVNTWTPLTNLSCMVKIDENVNASATGCKFVVIHNDSYKVTIDTSFKDNTPPEESVWVGLCINGVDPPIKLSFPSDTGNFHTMSFSLAVYLEEGDELEVKYYSVNSSGLVDIFRLQFTVVGELLCGFDVTGPPGPQGPQGDSGTDGYSCWDLNQNYFCDILDEDINGDGFCSVTDCTLSNITFDNVTGDICPSLEESGNLECLSDITITTPIDGDYLCWNDTQGGWTNGPIVYETIEGNLCNELDEISINCLGDVDLTGIQENDTLVYMNGSIVPTSLGSTEILRRALVNSTIPTNFRYNDPNGDPACTTSSSFISLSSFVYLGTDHDVSIGRMLAIVSTTNTAATGEIQLTDLTNSNTIIPATSFGPTNDVLVIMDSTSISNLPTDPAILQISVRRSSMGGGGSACLHSVQVLG